MGGNIYLSTGMTVSLATPLTSGIFALTTKPNADDADGRIVVKPSGALADASTQLGRFSHNTKEIIAAAPNLILGNQPAPSPSPLPPTPTQAPDAANVPKTGDSTDLPLYMALAVFSAMLLVTIALLGNKKKHARK